MCCIKYSPSGGLVNTAALHTNNPVFHYVYYSNTMLSAKLIQGADDVGHLHFLSVNGGGNTFFKGHGHIFGFIRCILGTHAKHQKMLVIRLLGRILQLQSFVAYVPEIPVPAVGGVRTEGKVDTVLPAVFYLRFPGVHRPRIVTPGCYYL